MFRLPAHAHARGLKQGQRCQKQKFLLCPIGEKSDTGERIPHFPQ
jgi:hypothetical protein